MPVTIPSAVLRQMDETERTRLIDAAFDWQPDTLANFLAELDARLRVFEQRYELPSDHLPEALLAGHLHDTADVSAWLFWAELRSELARKARP
jgi:uncharacterized tellurite resistance protein B-like protein